MIDYLLNDLDQKLKCKELHVRYEVINGSMGISQPWSISHDGLTFSVEQFDVPDEQKGVRNISVVSNSETEAHTVISSFHMFEQLLMLFEGRFLPLCDVEFLGSDEHTGELSDWYKERRPHYYQSADFTRCLGNLRLNPSSYITEQLFEKWIDILDDADIMHKIFMSVLSNGLHGNDLKLAFMIETAESMIELVQSRTVLFHTYKPGTSSTPLKMCIDGLITTYGQDIFSNELQGDYSTFLQEAVNSRVRIMHIKRKYKINSSSNTSPPPYFLKAKAIKYLVKFSYLYRRIILELLGIPYDNYSYTLTKAVEAWEKWYDENK